MVKYLYKLSLISQHIAKNLMSPCIITAHLKIATYLTLRCKHDTVRQIMSQLVQMVYLQFTMTMFKFSI